MPLSAVATQLIGLGQDRVGIGNQFDVPRASPARPRVFRRSVLSRPLLETGLSRYQTARATPSLAKNCPTIWIAGTVSWTLRHVP